jgi:putative Mn2+ efflux pump MntP
MEITASFLVAIGLAMDAMAVSLGASTSGKTIGFRSKFRMAFHFGLFQALMTILGWLVGGTVAGYVNQFDHWVGMVLLGYVGINMIRSGLGRREACPDNDPSKGKTLIMLCFATSIDAFAVGLGMAMLNTSILLPALIIGLVTLGLSSVGLVAGNLLSDKFGKRMEVLGGFILIGIGLRVVLTHIL